MNSPALSLPHQTPQKKRPAEVILTKRYEEMLQAIHQLRYVTVRSQLDSTIGDN